MAKNNSTAMVAGLAEFDAIGGQEVFTDRPIYSPDALGAAAKPVVGYVVCTEELARPKGSAPAADGRDTWTAYVIHLTRPTTLVTKDGEMQEVIAGREIFVARNAKNEALDQFLGKTEMFEVALLPNGKISLALGKLQDWKIKVTGKTEIRTGAFLVGGPSSAPALAAGATIGNSLANVNGAVAHAAP
jgi:hypothetical protein